MLFLLYRVSNIMTSSSMGGADMGGGTASGGPPPGPAGMSQLFQA